MMKKQEGLGVFAEEFTKFGAIEAFRMLRTNIQYASLGKEIKSIVVTSYNKGEGKSTITSNLAMTMVAAEQKVLLVDGDLRRPTIHELFGLPNFGLTNILLDNKLKEGIQRHVGGKNLDVICSGPVPPNPTELLSSKSMKDCLESLKEDYDIILIDSPPIGIITDAAILSTLVDGVIFVTKAYSTKKEELKQGLETLGKVQANILGVVLNDLKVKASNNEYYNYN